MTFLKGYKQTEEHKRKISLACIGRHYSKEVIKKGVKTRIKNGSYVAWNKGTKGIIKPNSGSFKKGHIKSAKSGMQKGMRPENNKKWVGKNHPNWKGGITPERIKAINSEPYRNWRKKIFERDNYICQICGQKKDWIEANHIKTFANYPLLRFEVSNGITLCKSCHRFIIHKERNYEWLFNGIVNYNPLCLA